MALSGNQITRIGTLGSPGRAYLGFVAKTETISVVVSFGVGAILNADAFGVVGAMDSDAFGVIGDLETNRLGAPVSAIFVNDTFTESADVDFLSEHTGETGASWAVISTYFDTLRIINSVDKAAPSNISTSRSGYYASGVPTGTEYDVEADIEHFNNTDDDAVPGICGRVSTSVDDMYYVQWSRSTNLWRLYKIVGGTLTLLGSYSDTFAVGITKSVRLEIRDATKKVFIDGVERISSTDNSITAKNRAGIRWSQSSFAQFGFLLDNFKATDTGSVYTPTFGANAILNDSAFGAIGSLDSDAFGVIGSLGE